VLRDKGIGRRLGLGFSLLVALLIVAGLSGLIGTGVTYNELETNFKVRLPALDALVEADRDLQQLLVAERSMLFADVKSEQFKTLVGEYESNLAQAEERINLFKTLANTPEEQEIVAKYEEARNTWLAASSQVVEGRKADTREGRRLALDLTMGEASSKFEAMRDYINQLTELGLKSVEEDHAKSEITFWITVAVISLITLASIAVGIFLGRSLTKGITGPLQEILDVSDAISRGDLNRKISYVSQDEVGRLADSLRRMLSGVIGEGQSIKTGISLPMFITDAKGVATYVSPMLAEIVQALTGRAAGDMLGKTPIGEMLPEKNNKAAEDVSQCLASNKTVQNEHFFDIQGKTLTVYGTIAPLYDLDGKLIGTMGIGVDMTEQKKQSEMIEEPQGKILVIAEQASGISTVLSEASQELFVQIEQVSEGARRQSERTTETATAMEEMNATVLEVAKNASQAADSAEAAKEKASAGEELVHRMVDSIHEVDKMTSAMRQNLNKLGAQAQDIGQIMNVISDIADQTNLLALNAAIEAARAGEAGRGFAVVADEVRKLAEKTMQATKEVGDAVRSIQDGTQASMADMDRAADVVAQSTGLAGEAGGALHEIVEIVDATTDQVRSIATASEEQSAASEEINRAVDDINSISNETASGMAQADQAVEQLAKQADDLKNLIQTLGAGEKQKALTS
jgi:methyl-accepting chemotaxis protein